MESGFGRITLPLTGLEMWLLLAAALILGATGADSHGGLFNPASDAGRGYGVGFVVPQGLGLKGCSSVKGRLQLRCPMGGQAWGSEPRLAAAGRRNPLESLSMVKVTPVTLGEKETSEDGATRVKLYDTTLRDGAQVLSPLPSVQSPNHVVY